MDLKGATIPGLPLDLTFLEVMESDLSGIDLSGRTLKNAHFYGVVLQKANFTKGTLDNIVFARGERVCDLTDANFAGAEVTEGVFDDSTLTRTDFTAASSLASASFLQTRMDGTRFDDCDVTTCRFSAPPRFSNDPANLTSFRGANLNYSTVLNQWSYLDLTGAKLVGLSPDVDLTYLEAVCAVLSGMDLSGYTLDQCNLTGATLTGARFSHAHMSHAQLYGVQNPAEVFRVLGTSSDYATFLSALQRASPSDVGIIFAKYGHPIVVGSVSVKTDNPNRWWTVRDSSSGAVFPVSNTAPSGPLTVMDARLVTRFDSAKLDHANFSRNNNQRTSLRGAVFSGAVLDNADLSWADFGQLNPYDPTSASVFTGASMNSAGLSQANLTGAKLTGTVYLHSADMVGVTLKGADLTGAQLGELAELFRVPESSSSDYQSFLTALEGQNLSGVAAIFTKYGHPVTTGQTSITVVVADRSWTITDSTAQTTYTVLNWTSKDNLTFLIVSTPTQAAALTSAYMPSATLVDANLYGVSAAYAYLYGSDVHLDGAILDNTTFANANLGGSSVIVKALYRVDLSGANLVNSTLKGADLTQHVTLSQANLQGADFTGTQMNGANLANAAVAVPVAPAIAGVYLFGIATTDQDYKAIQAELTAAQNQVNITPSGDDQTIKKYIVDFNNGNLNDLRPAFQQCGVTFSGQAVIESTEDPEAWQINGSTPPGDYTAWHGFDDIGNEGILARPSMPRLRAAFAANAAVAGSLRWQATITAGPGPQQWQVDNDSENPRNLQLGYATLLVAEDADGTLDFYGTTLRIEQLGDNNQLQIRTVTYNATVLCPKDHTGTQNCAGDGSGSYFGPYTICPNTRTLQENQQSFPPIPWAHMLRAPSPPKPPTCVPSPYGDCPQSSAFLRLSQRSDQA